MDPEAEHTMSTIPPGYNARSTETVEDCRDFLRTGRCKYGSSCKYGHPSNVQSGGGMRAPLDPSEPMFPIRPNEPVCQYFMKHGTCKFGQACKFHHPPQPPLQSVVNGRGNVMMNLGRSSEIPAQLVVNPIGTDPNGSMMLQFLPQRPNEPDCIYFLKNGRCKYGATCRYHHPISFHQQRRSEDQRRSRGISQDPFRGIQGVHYINQVRQGYTQEHGVDGITAQQLAADGTALHLPPGYQTVPIIASKDGLAYALPVTEGSSGSSLASSYDTASSTVDHLPSQADSTSSLWNRARRNGSGGSLSAYNIDSSAHGRGQTFLHSSASEGNIAIRNRSTSYGSDNSYYETVASMSRNLSSGSWRNDISMEPGRRVHSSPFGSRPEGGGNDISMDGGISSMGRSHIGAPRPMRRNTRRSDRAGESDEGFTMMTSALLNMLDTPEEAAIAGFDEEDRNLIRAKFEVDGQIDPSIFHRLSLGERYDGSPSQHPVTGTPSTTDSWSPTLRDAPNSRADQEDVLPMMRGHHQGGDSTAHSHGNSDVGLYLL